MKKNIGDTPDHLFFRSAPSKRSYGHRLKKREEELVDDEEEDLVNGEEEKHKEGGDRDWRTIRHKSARE